MNKAKKIVSLAVALLLMVGLLAACGGDASSTPSSAPAASGSVPGSSSAAEDSNVPDYMNATGYPVVKEPITVKVMAPISAQNGPFEDMLVPNKMEELTGIHIEWDTYDNTNYNEQKNLVMAGGDYPDVFYNSGFTTSDEDKYGPAGVFQNLSPLIEQYAPNVMARLEEKPDYRNTMTATDGNIYSLPYIVDTKTMAANIIYVDKRWLEAVELDKPATVEDLYEVLKAFKDGDPNGNGQADEIPLSYWKQDNTPANPNFMFDAIIQNAFSGRAGGTNFDMDGDTVVFNPMEDAYKEYMLYMNKLYSEGLLDQEMFTQNQQEYIAKYKDGRMGLSMVSLSVVLDVEQEDQVDNFELLAPLTSDSNSKQVTNELKYLNTGSFVITSACQYPEAMVRWADVFFQTEDEDIEGLNGLSNFLGIKGDTWDFDDDTKATYTRVSKEDGLSPVEYTNKYVMPGGFGNVVTGAVANGDVRLLKKATESDINYFPYMIPVYPYSVRYEADKAERLGFLENDVFTYVFQMRAKFITGEEDVEAKWDEFVNTLKTMGIEEMLEIKQEAYDAWKGA